MILDKFSVLRNEVKLLRKNIVIRNRKIVLSATKLEFPKILVPRLPQNTSNANIECAEKPKQLYSLWDQPLGGLLSSFYCSNINVYFQLIIPGENCAMYGYSSSRTIPVVKLYRSNTGETFL